MIRLPAAVLPGAALPGAALLAALLLTGCEIRSTDAIDAGGSATIQVFPGGGGGRTLLFLRSEGALMPVARPAPYESSVDPGAAEPPTADPSTTGRALAALFAGPLPDERAAGLTDGLPDLPGLPNPLDDQWDGGSGESGFEVEVREDGPTSVTLPVALGRLDDMAIRQVVCTVAYARDDEGRGAVRLRGTDGALETTACDADIDTGSLPRPRTAPDPDTP
ncbi:hypothetical protein OIE71_02770 [Streptomyces sp. NBC_01725]|uniref:hypothetical protein n=1 Tax=Streptomyces sp. NBC_01725 TaxID=2975923 RepID=UPI002E29CE26|nr:hypothetical protein [Streptomyces sp. NBC_01725]